MLAIATIFNKFGYLQKSLLEVIEEITQLSKNPKGLLSDVNISLAGIIYSLTAIGIFDLNHEHSVPSWRTLYIILNFWRTYIIPALLFVVWNLAFWRDNYIVFSVILLVCNCWIITGTKRAEENILRRYAGYLEFRDFRLTLSLVAISFPTNALTLIYVVTDSFSFYGEPRALTAWILAGVNAVINLFITLKDVDS